MLGVLRFSYEDLFGNKYYQDLPFTYAEKYQTVNDENKREQIIEIRDIKSPILAKQDEKMFEERVKEYDVNVNK